MIEKNVHVRKWILNFFIWFVEILVFSKKICQTKILQIAVAPKSLKTPDSLYFSVQTKILQYMLTISVPVLSLWLKDTELPHNIIRYFAVADFFYSFQDHGVSAAERGAGDTADMAAE